MCPHYHAVWSHVAIRWILRGEIKTQLGECALCSSSSGSWQRAPASKPVGAALFSGPTSINLQKCRRKRHVLRKRPADPAGEPLRVNEGDKPRAIKRGLGRFLSIYCSLLLLRSVNWDTGQGRGGGGLSCHSQSGGGSLVAANAYLQYVPHWVRMNT